MNIKLMVPILSLVLVGGCSPEGELEDEIPVQGDLQADSGDDKADRVPLTTTVFTDDIGSVGGKETRKLITTAGAYRTFFGHAAPREVDFSKEWVVFYSAGVKNTGGFTAAVKKVVLSNSGATLKVTTSLTSPGYGCFVTQALTKPYMLVKFKKPSPRPDWVSYYTADQTQDCEDPAPSCAAVLCGPGTVCELVDVVCVRAPCYPQPQCVPQDCPGAGTRNDAGKCECLALGLCIEPLVWNSEPGVCGCEQPAPAPTGFCRTTADCYEYDDYCGGCNCRAYSVNDTIPACTTTIVNCFAAPCQVNSGTLACVNNRCSFH
jgi:hypothetical protein